MAYDFAGTGNQHLTGAAPLSGAPFTVSAWFWINAASGNQSIVELTAGDTGHRFVLYTSGSTLQWFVNDTGFSQLNGATAVSANTWTHGCAVETATNNRDLYTNGTASARVTPNATTRNPASVDELYIGIDRANNAFASQLAGRVADVGIWNVALTADEISSLSKGVSCRLIRPQSLVFYAPLIRNLSDHARSLALTNGNSATVQVHPRIYA